MFNRCRICGAPVSDVTICNYCKTVKQERRFFNMIKGEELNEVRNIEQMEKSGPSKKVPPKKQTGVIV
ncbi:MAG: hypothetical protein PVI90_11995 [Desulfobacteraceae bacterium]|jgi:hypothetical protein